MRPRRSHPEGLPARIALLISAGSLPGVSVPWLWRRLSPYAVEHVAVFGDTQQLVVSGDLVEVGPFFIGKEQIRFPNGVQHGRVQVQRVVGVLAVGQPRVIPLLPQEDVHSVVLQNRRGESLVPPAQTGHRTRPQTANGPSSPTQGCSDAEGRPGWVQG